MHRILIFLCALVLAFPAAAQLNYKNSGTNTPAVQDKTADLAVHVKKTRGNETVVRPDWYGLFLLWAKATPSSVLPGLRDTATFENFSQFMACDYVRDFRTNDILWPQKQIAIVQKFNERVLNPQNKFRLLTRAVLGPYVTEQQQFVFKPLEGAAFSIKFPDDKIFGMEDDCEGGQKTVPQIPWPNEFLIGFDNPQFITALPMEKIKAQYFLDNLPKNEKGEQDRRLVVEVEFEVANFFPPAATQNGSQDRIMPPVHVGIKATRAIIYADADRKKELARFGF